MGRWQFNQYFSRKWRSMSLYVPYTSSAVINNDRIWIFWVKLLSLTSRNFPTLSFKYLIYAIMLSWVQLSDSFLYVPNVLIHCTAATNRAMRISTACGLRTVIGSYTEEVALRLLLNVPPSRTVTKWGSRTTSDGDGGGTPPPDKPSFFPYLVLGQVNFVI